MITPETKDFIRAARTKGDSDETIIANLKATGWDDLSITQAMEESKNTDPQPKKRWFYIKVGLVLLAVVVIILGGLKSYSYFANNPEKIWADTTGKMLNISSAHYNFEASYTAQAPSDDSDSGFGEFLGKGAKMKFSVNGHGAMVIHKDKNDADFDMDSTIGAQLGSLNISFNFLSKKLGNFIYYKVDGNPLLSLFGGSESNQTAQWLKIDINDTESSGLQTITTIQKNQIQEAFKKAKLMKPTKLLGSETIDNAQTWHYQATLDKQELKNYFAEIEKTLNLPDEDAKSVNTLLDKIEFQKLEVWIGKSDHLIHQALIESNAPNFITSSLDSARNKSRDARRLADASQIRVGLELFYNDNGRYPASDNGEPSKTDGGKNNFSTYISTYPQAPIPADGTCTDTNNKYIYQQLDKGKSYKLDFCLGNDSGGGSYKAGIVEVTPEEMKTITPSNAGPPDPLEGVEFNGLISIKLNLSQFNSNVNIEQPQGEIEDVGAISRDAKRLADVRQLMTVAELYYNDFGKYPTTLSQAEPKYIAAMLAAPTPPDGACTAADNNYSYQSLQGGQSYTLTFCLGAATGGYQPGKLTADPSGIK